MKIDMDKERPRWFKMEDKEGSCEFLIVPFPHSKLADADFRVNLRGETTSSLSIDWLKYNTCLQGWKGMETDKGKEVKFNDKNKKYVFDYFEDIRMFVLQKANDLDGIIEEEIKN